MKKQLFLSAAVVAACATPSAAFAQDGDNRTEVFVGPFVGFHDLGFGEDVQDATGIDLEDSSPIAGGFVGVDFPLGDAVFAGVEANVGFGTDAIDTEYGLSARLGLNSGGTKFYVRGGYQWVDFDNVEILDIPGEFVPDALDDDYGDYLVGGGVEVPLGSLRVRGNIDTIAFDTFRATAGVAFTF